MLVARNWLAAARGLIRVEEEPEGLDATRLAGELQPLVEGERSFVGRVERGGNEHEALYVPLRKGTEIIGLARLSEDLVGRDLQCPRQFDNLLDSQAPDPALDLRDVLGVGADDLGKLRLTQVALLAQRPQALPDLFLRQHHVLCWLRHRLASPRPEYRCGFSVRA